MPLRKEEERRREKINFCLMLYVASFVLEQKEIVLAVAATTTTEFFFRIWCSIASRIHFPLSAAAVFFVGEEERERERWKRTYFTRIATKKGGFPSFLFPRRPHTGRKKKISEKGLSSSSSKVPFTNRTRSGDGIYGKWEEASGSGKRRFSGEKGLIVCTPSFFKGETNVVCAFGGQKILFLFGESLRGKGP